MSCVNTQAVLLDDSFDPLVKFVVPKSYSSRCVTSIRATDDLCVLKMFA